MGIGIKTCKDVFNIILSKGFVSRKEISDELGISIVSVCKAADFLIKNELISERKNKLKSSGKGRNTSLLEISKSKVFLAIALSPNYFSYTITHICKSVDDVQYFSYVNSLDFCDNISVFASSLSKWLKQANIHPTLTAVSLPFNMEDGDIKEVNLDFIKDYSGESITDIFKNCGIMPDLVVSSKDCLDTFFGKQYGEKANYAFMCIEDKVLGCGKNQILTNWGNIKVSFDKNLTYNDILRCNLDNTELSNYTERLILTVNDVLDPDVIAISTYLSDEILASAKEKVNMDIVSDKFPVLSGLIYLIEDKLFNLLTI